jgi:urea transport system permease protein
MLCGVAGALYVPQVGIINPSEMAPVNSIEMAIWVAIGGRGSLVGAIAGAFIVNGAKSFFTAYFAEYWLFFLGAMFVLVPLLLPQGVIGLLTQFSRKRAQHVPTEAVGDVPHHASPVSTASSASGDRA